MSNNMPPIVLKEGEMICSRCEGTRLLVTGEMEFSSFDGTSIPSVEICDKCLGTGKVDWVENVVGKDDGLAIHILSNNPPTSASLGSLWEDSTNGNTYTFTKHGWVLL